MLASGRFPAFSCQHLSAIFQTAGVIPGVSKRRGFDGRLPFSTKTNTLLSKYSGNGTLPVAS